MCLPPLVARLGCDLACWVCQGLLCAELRKKKEPRLAPCSQAIGTLARRAHSGTACFIAFVRGWMSRYAHVASSTHGAGVGFLLCCEPPYRELRCMNTEVRRSWCCFWGCHGHARRMLGLCSLGNVGAGSVVFCRYSETRVARLRVLPASWCSARAHGIYRECSFFRLSAEFSRAAGAGGVW